jgi:hypothetical protein
MQVIWLLGVNYNKKKVETVIPSKRIIRIFFTIFFWITSNPFAIIIEAGMRK